MKINSFNPALQNNSKQFNSSNCSYNKRFNSQYDQCNFTSSNENNSKLSQKEKLSLNINLIRNKFDKKQRETILSKVDTTNKQYLDMLLEEFKNDKSREKNIFDDPDSRFSAKRVTEIFDVLNPNNQEYLPKLLKLVDKHNSNNQYLIIKILTVIPAKKDCIDAIFELNDNSNKKEFELYDIFALMDSIDDQNKDLFFHVINIEKDTPDTNRYKGEYIRNVVWRETYNRDNTNPEMYKDFVKKVIDLKAQDNKFVFDNDQIVELLEVSSYREKFISDLLDYKKEDGNILFNPNKIIYLADSCNPDFGHYIFGANMPTKKARYRNATRELLFSYDQQEFVRKNIDVKKKTISKLLAIHQDDLDNKNISNISNITAQINHMNYKQSDKLLDNLRLSLGTISLIMHKQPGVMIQEINPLLEAKTNGDFRFSDEEIQSITNELNSVNVITLSDILNTEKDDGTPYKTKEIIDILKKLANVADYKLEQAKKQPPKSDEPYFITVANNTHSYNYNDYTPRIDSSDPDNCVNNTSSGWGRGTYNQRIY